VGVLQAGRDLDLAVKALRAEGRGQLRLEDLEGDGALVLEILRQEDRGHPAAPELALQRVLACQSSLQLRLEVGHEVALLRKRRDELSL
jgi:hypothetical protein